MNIYILKKAQPLAAESMHACSCTHMCGWMILPHAKKKNHTPATWASGALNIYHNYLPLPDLGNLYVLLALTKPASMTLPSSGQ